MRATPIFKLVFCAILAVSGLLFGVQERMLSKVEHESLLKMQQFQAAYDEDFWFNKDFEKFRHVLLHLMDNVGKMAKYCEAKEHGKDPEIAKLIDEVVPDIFMHVLQFANAFDIDLSQKYEERINQNIKKITASAN
jgi:NTP pyrophosphatase (non-canonical NTP hydrolase)